MPSIYVLVGPISSGKSTYARKRADEGALVICHDDLTQMLHGGVYRYQFDLRVCYRAMEEAMVRVAIKFNKDVIVDRTHLTRESRLRWLTFARTIDETIEVIAVVFPILLPYEHACRRYTADSRGRHFHEWLQVAQHHGAQARLEPLADDEGFDRIVRIDPEHDHEVETEQQVPSARAAGPESFRD